MLESVGFQSIAAARPVIVEFVGRRFTAAQAQELADWVEGVRGGFGAVSVPLALLSGERVVPSPRVRTLGRDSFQVPGMLADQALFSSRRDSIRRPGPLCRTCPPRGSLRVRRWLLWRRVCGGWPRSCPAGCCGCIRIRCRRA